MGGIDSQLTKIRTTPGEFVSVSHGDPVATTAGALADMNNRFASLERLMTQQTVDTNKLMRAATVTGFYVRGQDPESPIPTRAA